MYHQKKTFFLFITLLRRIIEFLYYAMYIFFFLLLFIIIIIYYYLQLQLWCVAQQQFKLYNTKTCQSHHLLFVQGIPGKACTAYGFRNRRREDSQQFSSNIRERNRCYGNFLVWVRRRGYRTKGKNYFAAVPMNHRRRFQL